MSVLRRPAGDEISQIYGEYLSLKELKLIGRGDRYEVLCTDGLNYHVDVKEVDLEKDKCHLHFIHWSKQMDYKGSIKKLYLARLGSYSAGISAQNHYPVLQQIEEAEKEQLREKSLRRKKESPHPEVDAQKNSFYSSTKYPDDFLSKPRLSFSGSGRKRLPMGREASPSRKRTTPSKRREEEAGGEVEESEEEDLTSVSDEGSWDVSKLHHQLFELPSEQPAASRHPISSPSGENESMQNHAENGDSAELKEVTAELSRRSSSGDSEGPRTLACRANFRDLLQFSSSVASTERMLALLADAPGLLESKDSVEDVEEYRGIWMRLLEERLAVERRIQNLFASLKS